jgi:hypothetical protein
MTKKERLAKLKQMIITLANNNQISESMREQLVAGDAKCIQGVLVSKAQHHADKKAATTGIPRARTYYSYLREYDPYAGNESFDARFTLNKIIEDHQSSPDLVPVIFLMFIAESIATEVHSAWDYI